MEDKQYPIGRLHMPVSLSKEEKMHLIQQINTLPRQLRSLVEGISDEQQRQTYRDGAWNVRELVHHIADSHVELYVAIRQAITANKPLIKEFDENAWAALPDMKLPMDVSLNIIGGIHYRAAALLEGLSEAQWGKGPEGELSPVEQGLVKLNWHGQHHVKHIELALNQKALPK